MKKILSCLLVCCILLCILPVLPVVAKDFPDHVTIDGLVFKIENGEAILTDTTEDFADATSLVLPEKVEGFPVTEVADSFSVFCESHNLTSITLPNGLKRIGKDTFSKQKITEIVIPDTVTHIDDEAFSYSPLAKITMSKNIEFVHHGAFEGSKYLFQNTTEPIYFGNVLFSVPYCNDKIFEVKEGTTVIAENAFYSFSGPFPFSEIVLPKSVTHIYPAFKSCSALRKINIPENVEFIAEGAFEGCWNLKFDISPKNKNFKFEDGLLIDLNTNTLLETDSSHLSELIISEKHGIKRIGFKALRGCFANTVKLPEGLLEIGEYAFEGMAISDIDIPDSVRYIEHYAFYGSSLFREYYKGDLVIDNHLIQVNREAEGVYTVAAGIVSISDNAFAGCDKLTEIIIPEGVKYIGEHAFSFCENLKKLSLPDSVEYIGDYPLSGFIEPYDVEINVPANLKRVPVRLYSSAASMEFTFPNGITELGEGAFRGGHKINGPAVLGNGITSIPRYAFYECEIEEIHIPLSVKEIGAYNFGTSDLVIHYEGTPAAWEKILIAEEGNYYLKQAEIRFGNKKEPHSLIGENGELNGFVAAAIVIGLLFISATPAFILLFKKKKKL